MSFIAITKDLNNIEKYIEKYELLIEEHQDFFNMEGKKLEYICKTLPLLVRKFKQASYELKTYTDSLKLIKENTESFFWKKYTENSRRQLDKKDLQMYIQQEPEWITISECLLEIEHIKYKIQAILDALDVAHWQMNNITKIRIASLEEDVL